jgi:ribonuclease HII
MQQALAKIQTSSLPRGTLGKKIPRVPLGRDFFDDVLVLLDGGLKAPGEYVNQETIIKGDSKEKVIGLASIMAKVTRDAYMVRVSTEFDYAPYKFEVHKGYGTKAHREAILKNGLTKEHRKSFCKNLQK